MNKVIIVPDVHGRRFWRDLITESNYDRIIFLGDYGDPYDSEGITHEEAISELKDIIDLKNSNYNKVTLLLGNHDIHYLNSKFACSRYSYEYNQTYRDIFTKNINLFQVADQIKQNGIDYLFTHAGVNKGWKDLVNLDKYDSVPAIALNKLVNQHGYSDFAMVSWYRGGIHKYASPIWTDIHEHDTIGAYPDIIQIFGHSQVVHPKLIGNIWCIDCRKIFILENNLLKIY